MTRSEAKAITESTARALRALNGMNQHGFPGIPWTEFDEKMRNRLLEVLRAVQDEVQRVYDMAAAEVTR